MDNQKVIVCHYCDFTCEEYVQLARHIVQNRASHSGGLKWASKFNLKVNALNLKRDIPQRTALTEEQVQAKEDCQRHLSGMDRVVIVQCPQCNIGHQARLETEYLKDLDVWTNQLKRPMVLCQKCQ